MAVSTETNMFRNVTTVTDLEFEYMVRSSPENVSWDGERPAEAVKAAYKELQQHYEARLEELAPYLFN